jgi:hypothetical protein
LSTAVTKLSSLAFLDLNLQLQPGTVQGVLGGPTVPPLKQLWIYEWRLLDGDEGLEHLSFTNNHDKDLLGLVED